MLTGFDNPLVFGLCLLWAVFAAGLVWYLASALSDMRYATLADGRRQERRLPFLFRALLPLAPYVTPFFSKPQFDRSKTNISRQLTSAGFDNVVFPEEFLSLRVLIPLATGVMLMILLIGHFAFAVNPAAHNTGTRLVVLALALFLWMCLYPRLWLKRAIALRHKLILKALPFVIDLLTLSVEAGMDFMAAIQNIIERRAMDPVGEELSRVLVEIQLGKTRREALKHMGERIQQADVYSLVTALVQADELGVSIGATLRIQSDQIRAKRFMRAEKLANEAPVKMLFPLLVCIFPAVMLILLGPVILQMLRQGF